MAVAQRSFSRYTRRVRFKKEQYRERFYPDSFRGMYDRFSDVIHEYVRAGDVMLDAGCGSGRVFQYRFDAHQRPRLIVGVDVTKEPYGNQNIDAAARADLGRQPFRDGMFDVAISLHVAEHRRSRSGYSGSRRGCSSRAGG